MIHVQNGSIYPSKLIKTGKVNNRNSENKVLKVLNATPHKKSYYLAFLYDTEI